MVSPSYRSCDELQWWSYLRKDQNLGGFKLQSTVPPSSYLAILQGVFLENGHDVSLSWFNAQAFQIFGSILLFNDLDKMRVISKVEFLRWGRCSTYWVVFNRMLKTRSSNRSFTCCLSLLLVAGKLKNLSSHFSLAYYLAGSSRVSLFDIIDNK
jgi:uncharacterized metal-binding protein